MMLDTITQIDYLDLLRSLPDRSVDMILTDPPYNNTALHFDTSLVDYAAFFAEAWRVLKDKDRACLLFAGGRLEYTLKYEWHSKGYRREWIWLKSRGVGSFDANREPLEMHEHILVFSQRRTRYFPQMIAGKPYRQYKKHQYEHYGKAEVTNKENDGLRYPGSVLFFPNHDNAKSLHPTQKPVELCAYLINTYTQPGEVVVDPFGGSGTTAEACVQTDRHYIVGDNHAPYCEIARQRVMKPIQRELLG